MCRVAALPTKLSNEGFIGRVSKKEITLHSLHPSAGARGSRGRARAQGGPAPCVHASRISDTSTLLALAVALGSIFLGGCSRHVTVEDFDAFKAGLVGHVARLREANDRSKASVALLREAFASPGVSPDALARSLAAHATNIDAEGGALAELERAVAPTEEVR